MKWIFILYILDEPKYHGNDLKNSLGQDSGVRGIKGVKEKIGNRSEPNGNLGSLLFHPVFWPFAQLRRMVPGYLSKHGKESQLGVLLVDSVVVERNQWLTMPGKPSKIYFSFESFRHKVQAKTET